MFGVDKEGKDVLSAQFSKEPKGRSIKPGSLSDMQMMETSNYMSLSRQPETQKMALEQALNSLYESGRIQLDTGELETIRREIIEKRFAAYLRSHEEAREHKDRVQSTLASEIRGENLYHDTQLDTQMEAYQRKQKRQMLEKEVTVRHPNVIKEGLRRGYEAGRFASFENEIKQAADAYIKKLASERAYEGAQEQMIMASRSAIQNISPQI